MQPYPGLLFTKAADGKCSINHFTGDLWGTLQNKFKNTVSSGHFYTFLMHNKQLSRKCYTTDNPSSLYREKTCDSHHPQHDECSYGAMAFLVFHHLITEWTYQTFEGRIQSVSGLHLLWIQRELFLNNVLTKFFLQSVLLSNQEGKEHVSTLGGVVWEKEHLARCSPLQDKSFLQISPLSVLGFRNERIGTNFKH